MTKRQQLSPKQKYLAFGALGLIGFILLTIIANLTYERIYYGRVYPGLKFLDQSISGLDAASLRQLINDRAVQADKGINVCLAEDCLTIQANVNAGESAIDAQLFAINQEETFNNIFNYGRAGDFGQNLWDRLSSLIVTKNFKLSARLDREAARDLLSEYFSYSHKAVREAGLALDNDGQLVLTAESEGSEPDYQVAIERLGQQLLIGDNQNIALQTKVIRPTIYQANTFNINQQAEQLLTSFPITWRYGERFWTVNASTAKTWLGLSLDRQGKVALSWDKTKVQTYLSEHINQDIAVPMVDPKFTVSGGRVYIEASAQEGLEVDYEASLINFFTALAQGQKDIAVATRPLTSQVQGLEGLESLEILGVGTSTFSGSPKNRRANIRVGAASINGVLIKPDEEFSLIKALGKIDDKAGYLPELVIKGDKTVPEYGGGLCQIGTTLFRAVISSGLPVTMRRNHSYRVAYYEPAGTDATIYDPLPDFRFINDTGKPILLQTKISGDQAVFTFWGQRDGRQASHTKPTIYNITKPLPTKIVETTELKPGEKKCTEKAHNGADAYFDYQVIYPGGEEKKVRFSSHYVPWREVCLVGVTASSTVPIVSLSTTPELAEGSASSTIN